MPSFFPCSDLATAMSSIWPASAQEWILPNIRLNAWKGKENYNFASMRRDPTPTILLALFSMTIVK
jgi:hypothetical protein